MNRVGSLLVSVLLALLKSSVLLTHTIKYTSVVSVEFITEKEQNCKILRALKTHDIKRG